MGGFHLVKISGISGSAVNEHVSLVRSTGKFPEKVASLKLMSQLMYGLFFRWPHNGGLIGKYLVMSNSNIYLESPNSKEKCKNYINCH